MFQILVFLLSLSLSASNQTMVDKPNCGVSSRLMLAASAMTLFGVVPLIKTWMIMNEKGFHAFEPIDSVEHEEAGYYELGVMRVPKKSERHWWALACVPITLGQLLGVGGFVDTYVKGKPCLQSKVHYASVDLYMVSFMVKLLAIPFLIAAYRNHRYYEISVFSIAEGFPVLAMLLGFIGFGCDANCR